AQPGMIDQGHSLQWTKKSADVRQRFASAATALKAIFLQRGMQNIPIILDQARQHLATDYHRLDAPHVCAGPREIDSEPDILRSPALRLDQFNDRPPVYRARLFLESLFDLLAFRIVEQVFPAG